VSLLYTTFTNHCSVNFVLVVRICEYNHFGKLRKCPYLRVLNIGSLSKYGNLAAFKINGNLFLVSLERKRVHSVFGEHGVVLERTVILNS